MGLPTWLETEEPLSQEGNTLPAVIAAEFQLQMRNKYVVITKCVYLRHMWPLLVSVAHAFGMVGHAIAAKCGKYEKEVKA